MERMSEHTELISSYQLLITAACTNTGGKMKGSHPRAADRCPFVLRHILSQVTSFMQLGMLWHISYVYIMSWIDIIMLQHLNINHYLYVWLGIFHIDSYSHHWGQTKFLLNFICVLFPLHELCTIFPCFNSQRCMNIHFSPHFYIFCDISL